MGHVYLNVAHSTGPESTWYGDSVGHYEGDVLVVDTIGLNDLTHIDRFATPHSDRIHVVERYRVTDGGQMMLDDKKVRPPRPCRNHNTRQARLHPHILVRIRRLATQGAGQPDGRT